ncbi:hypothetical protein BV394_02455 [Brevirhabdus pacifica]|uniref:Uncharacterized protein n=1 Tax=Brevirhabdus pacifica TaxID=1267768 RepID=A0A1U7DFI3_9RHOB|nr:YIP1 family protein [Brevirhabdus pacifica]APX88732.1 hypothetical protein BV394_02455 [Brevirhabdus pacifica]PJJ86748.1 Yip1-like protein [Brevirhabdus pacifica]
MSELNLGGTIRLAGDTVTDPKGVAHRLMGLGLPRPVLWQAVTLVVVLSVMLAQVTAFLAPMAMGMEAMLGGPLVLGVIQIGLTVLMILGTFYIGRGFGGTGTLDDTILLIAWLQVVMILLQVVQTVLLVVLPPLAAVVGVAGLVIFVWIYINFVAALHGFASLGLVFAGAVVSLLGGLFGLSLILTLIGISAPEM